MKKVGTITESRMARPAEPKSYPVISDSMFGGKVILKEGAKKGYPEKGIKGGTKAAAKEAAKRAKAKKVGNAKLLKDDDVLPVKQNLNNKVASMSNYNSQRGNTENPGNEKVYNSMTDAKDPNWIQGAEKDIERRGTEGKCTPITKPGCTGRAKALAKTFKKMAKKRDEKIVSKKEKAALKKEAAGQGWTTNSKGEKVYHPDSPEFKKITADREKKAKAWRDSLGPMGGDKKDLEKEAFEPLAQKRGTAKPVRKATASAEARPHKKLTPRQAKNVAGNEKAEMGTRMRAADQM